MPNWKKLITSGSDASLSSLSLSGVSGQSSEKTSLMINGNGLIGTRELGSLAFSSATYNNYTLPLGSSSTRGGFKIGYSESGKNYPVELSSEKMYVNVPWTDTNTQLSDAEIAALGYIKTASDTNTQNTYSTSVVSSSGTKLRLTGAGEAGATTDDVKFVGAGATTVSRTDASTITITSTDTNTDTDTQRSDKEIEEVIEKNVNPVVSATVSNDTTTFTKQDGTTFALTTSDANNNTVT